MLHSVQHIHLSSVYAGDDSAPLHVLARWTQIPATTELHLPYVASAAPAQLAIKGWGRGWRPARRAASRARSPRHDDGAVVVVVALDDSDVAHYLSLVAGTDPSRLCEYVVWLGKQVSARGFSRLLSCPQQPPLGLHVDSAAVVQLEPYVVGWTSYLGLNPSHFKALIGLSAPRLETLVLSGCGQLANSDVAMLAGACHALKALKLRGASRLSDPALHALAVGCPQLERVQVTHASVTAEGVLVVLAMLGRLQTLEVGGMPRALLEQLGRLVNEQLRGPCEWGCLPRYGVPRCDDVIEWRRP
jgi:hypothetical protein